MAAAIPIMMIAGMAASTATSVIAATRTPQMPKQPDPNAARRAELEAAYAQADLLRKRQGQASTILTGPMGVQNGSAGQATRATLGG